MKRKGDSLAAWSPREFEALVERVVDRRLELWLTQLMDALGDDEKDEETSLAPDFAASLKRAIEQARAGQTISLQSFRAQLADESV